MQIIYSFIGTLLALAVVLAGVYIADLKDRLDSHIKKEKEEEEANKIPYRNSSYQYAPYRPPYYSSPEYQITQLTNRVNDIIDDLDDLKLKFEEKFEDPEEESMDEDSEG